ncbi:hypothetical protein FB45DRAFT_473287 [Roridomyces roridus]|uniref:Zn(2)-C6 fungal-type domain-containing protein n=1 Tax=Roridomyces roridus TaxID=1738132 RepID=A0AAD7BZ45_9AGAR|nr:hypothetical protein FB45DRAFT_473287 [Roridomyces roridus]
MHPNRSSSSKLPVIKPPPGHSRNRIACVNCRRRKIKCITDKKNPNYPCQRCVKEGANCEYIAATSDDERASPQPDSTRPTTVWVEPLDPESYARRNNASGPPSQSGTSAAHPGLPVTPPFQYEQGYGQSDSYLQAQFTNNFNMPANFLGSQYPPPPSNVAPNVHYGPFPGPAGTVYPWTQHQHRSPSAYTGGCSCHPAAPCVCGRRGV